MTFGGESGSPLGSVESLEHFVCVAHWRDVVIPDLVTQQVSGEFGGGWTWRKNNFFKLFFFLILTTHSSLTLRLIPNSGAHSDAQLLAQRA